MRHVSMGIDGLIVMPTGAEIVVLQLPALALDSGLVSPLLALMKD